MPLLSTTPLKAKVKEASQLYHEHLLKKDQEEENNGKTPITIAVAPGRVNLIGEHTDYTGGFVLPFAIDYSTVVYGHGSLTMRTMHDNTNDNDNNNKSRLPPSASLCFVSSKSSNMEVVDMTIDPSSTPPEKVSWTTYVAGTVFQYLQDLPDNAKLNLVFAISSDVPLGSGLSSSAALEVSVATFIESIVGPDMAFSPESSSSTTSKLSQQDRSKLKALRCQKAENTWCQSPCGIMDQYVSSAAQQGSLLLIDCRSLAYEMVQMMKTKKNDDATTTTMPVLVVANSNVKHDIGGGEYPIRVAQCQTATKLLKEINPSIVSLRDATLQDVELAKGKGLFDNDLTSYKRAKHVVTENERTLQAKKALEDGDWDLVGQLMNASHESMKHDYEVSCEEIDVLVELAQSSPGVYGSRLTGGGFGGCTVTLVKQEEASSLMETFVREYKAKTGMECSCFVTQPGPGAYSWIQEQDEADELKD